MQDFATFTNSVTSVPKATALAVWFWYKLVIQFLEEKGHVMDMGSKTFQQTLPLIRLIKSGDIRLLGDFTAS